MTKGQQLAQLVLRYFDPMPGSSMGVKLHDQTAQEAFTLAREIANEPRFGGRNTLTDDELRHISQPRVNYSALIVPKAAQEIMDLRERLLFLERQIERDLYT